MVCAPDSPDAKAGSGQEATTPTPGSPESLAATTPASHFDRPANPTPDGSKNKGKYVVAPPVTPKNPESRSFLSPGQPSTVSSLTPRSINVRQVATSLDGVVFNFSGRETPSVVSTFSAREPPSIASAFESWENAINFRQGDGLQLASPSGSNRTVVTHHRQGSTGIRSWYTIPDSDDYDVEQQPLLSDGPLSLTVPQRHDYDYGTLPHVTHADIHPNFWDCFSEAEMLVICALLTATVWCFIWTIIGALAQY
ncbi:hypothetical protein F5Y00DRAFT_262005 [Daldinia vernicosa]|uniref:uncharacterized protein n=1 Tax=Daldinia vernicosa TaxID=114800 RepID=UPI0020078FEF|nr:uncharacterized protein F5Y00DRAFT_262005 [Daldinia vernicosa]KAI0848848.1 hypothetical protein F5Y00DRAFT_262005 [Daldinia vernicosa]